MRRLRLGLALGATLSLGLAASAQGAVSTESTWSLVSATGSSAGGSKSAPAPFSGAWELKAVNNVDPAYRPVTPSSWSWSWEGVTVRQQGIPSCTVEAINDAKTVSVCPPASHIGLGPPVEAMFGPTGSAEGPNTVCLGKTFDLWNGPAGQLIMVLDGPPEQCGTLGFLGAYPITLATSGGKTTMTWSIAENIQHPFPGVDGSLRGGSWVFNKVTAKGKSAGATAAAKKKGKKKKKKVYSLFTSINCKGSRDFAYTVVDSFGTHNLAASAGNCKAPKKPKKKKKGKK